MKLLLSGGNAEGVVTLDEFFASQIDLSRTVLYVPVADKETNYDQRFEWFKRTYNKYGIFNIEMCIDLNKAVISDIYTAIYIGGGNTFKLLKEIKESGFDKKLIDFINRGGFVYGLSAGSIIFSEDITSTTYDSENTIGFEDSTGLNLVKGFNICCHYGNGDYDNTNYKRNRIQEYSAQSYGTIALPDGCAAYIQDDTITFMGSGVLLFKNS
jgi:dipeptidase E